MQGINSVTLVGTLGRDPETRHTKDGVTVARLSVATGRWDKRDGKEVTDWHRVTCFGKRAEYVEKYLKKGSKVAISNARIEYGSYEKEGVKVYTTDIVAFDVQGMDSRKDAESRSQGGGEKPGGARYPAVSEDDDDDIPF